MKSIQRHLTLTLLATVLTLSAAAGIFLYILARSRLLSEFDRGLASEAQAVAARVSRDSNGELEFNFPDNQAFPPQDRRPAYFELWSAEQVIYRSPSLGSADLPRPRQEPQALSHVLLPTGRQGRGTVFQFSPRADEEDEAAIRAKPPGRIPPPPVLTLLLAREPHALEETLWVLGSSLFFAELALALGTLLAVTLAVRRGLQPLHRLAAEADAIDADSLHHRFSQELMPIELRPICGRLNSLLDRLAQAFARERRFASDAAHELRTPIAELRALTEVALRWPQDASPESTYRDALAIARQMEAMVTSLLSIARCEAGLVQANLQRLDLAQVVRNALEVHQPVGSARKLSVQLDTPASVFVRSDPVMLAALIGNLASNAFTYTPENGSIVCRLSVSQDQAEFSIANTCHDLTPDDLPHLFDPFWRKDVSRTGTLHCGLGLSLVLAYAKSLGITPAVRLLEGNSFGVTLLFPGDRRNQPDTDRLYYNSTKGK